MVTSQWITGPDEFDSRDGYDPDFGFGCEPPDEEADLWVSGADVSPEQCGTWAAAWLEWARVAQGSTLRRRTVFALVHENVFNTRRPAHLPLGPARDRER